ncbi:MAG: radical SAM protein [Candidatus Bathyarchaeota archaeon]|nr:radical SAM protein [Candidatus Bathyarchaeota archaeon]
MTYIEREEPWGKLRYDLLKHKFSCIQTNGKNVVPYSQKPVVLNVDLTMKCNMNCMYCVTKDFKQAEDLVISKKLVDWINESPFMAVVITGGEPLLPEYEKQLITLLQKIENKGLIIDTNGTILPSDSVMEAIHESHVLVRISCDAARSGDEIHYRHLKPYSQRNMKENLEYYNKKIDMMEHMRSEGVNVAIQSVAINQNRISLENMPSLLKKYSINHWYIQRFIPSYKAIGRKLGFSNVGYDQLIEDLTERCNKMNIEFVTKKDRRHNCVVLLVGDGILYTQGEKPGQKLTIGTIHSKTRYFDYISSADHAERYYI